MTNQIQITKSTILYNIYVTQYIKKQCYITPNFTIQEINNNDYFKCDCVYHKKGFILCEICEQIINEDNKKYDGFIEVKRWKNNKIKNNDKVYRIQQNQQYLK